MKFVEIEYILNENAKRIFKELIRIDTILSIRNTHKKNPIIYYQTHTGTICSDFDMVNMGYLTQNCYKKLKNILEGIEDEENE